MKQPNVIVHGSLAHDRILNFPGRFSDHILPDKIHVLSVSFTLEKFSENFGGTAGNIGYNLQLLKIPTSLVASLGATDKTYLSWLTKNRLVGKGLRFVEHEATAFAYVMTDRVDNQITGFYPGAMSTPAGKSLRAMLNRQRLNYLVIAPGNIRDMIRLGSEAVRLGVPYLFDPGQALPGFTRQQLCTLITGCDVLISNDYELKMIEKTTGWNRREIERLMHVLITTLGPQGSLVRHGRSWYRIPAAKPENQSDPTGAGDAYRAGFLKGYLSGQPLPVAGRLGSLASVYTVETYGTQTHRFTLAAFKKRYYRNFKSRLSL